MKKKLFIITNESFYNKDNSFFCDNIDLKAIPEELSKYFEICLIGRKSKKIRTKKINIKSIKIFSNIISYSFFIIKSLIYKDGNYFIISVSPYTSIASIILKFFCKKHFIYVRSDGYEEYKSIFGLFGKTIYHIMFTIYVLSICLSILSYYVLSSIIIIIIIIIILLLALLSLYYIILLALLYY